MKEKVVLFGASVGGENYVLNQQDYEILAIADNDSNKIGTLLQGIEIISPKDIFNYDFKYIIVTSTYFNPIKKQLVEQLNVSEHQILAARKSLLKGDIYPFEDKKTREFANSTLLNLCDFLIRKGITYFLDYGTLLGIVRDENIINWDDDIDITCYLKDSDFLIAKLEEFIKEVSDERISWSRIITKHPKGHLSSIVLTFEDKENEFKDFHIDIWLLYFEEGLAIQSMNRCSKEHFEKVDKIMYRNTIFNAPYKHEEYLKHTYGDWKTPKKDTTFADYPYAFES